MYVLYNLIHVLPLYVNVDVGSISSSAASETRPGRLAGNKPFPILCVCLLLKNYILLLLFLLLMLLLMRQLPLTKLLLSIVSVLFMALFVFLQQTAPHVKYAAGALNSLLEGEQSFLVQQTIQACVTLSTFPDYPSNRKCVELPCVPAVLVDLSNV